MSTRWPELLALLAFLQCNSRRPVSVAAFVAVSILPPQSKPLVPLSVSADFYYDTSKLPCRTGIVSICRPKSSSSKEGTFDLSFKLFRPMTVSSQQAAPLVVLHGGPSLPSDYLLPLAKVIPYRSILFYDQLGCGDSDEPQNSKGDDSEAASLYSIERSVDDLESILQKLSIRQFHLLGHSYGGVLAYEYIKRQAKKQRNGDDDVQQQHPICRSLTLASAPANISETIENMDTLTASLSNNPELFRQTHECRTEDGKIPQPLLDAYAKAGRVWSGLDVVDDYVATGMGVSSGSNGTEKPKPRSPSTMLLSGEHDFINDTSRWKDLLSPTCRSVREKILASCSHHAHLEDPVQFGTVVDEFMSEYD